MVMAGWVRDRDLCRRKLRNSAYEKMRVPRTVKGCNPNCVYISLNYKAEKPGKERPQTILPASHSETSSKDIYAPEYRGVARSTDKCNLKRGTPKGKQREHQQRPWVSLALTPV